MMGVCNYSLTSVFVLLSFVIATSPHPGSVDHSSLLLDAPPGNISSLIDAAAWSLNSTNAGPLISCSGLRYRTGLKLLSCLDAVNRIPQDTASLRFAPRDGGVYDVALPSRFISCECWVIVAGPFLRVGVRRITLGSRWTVHHRYRPER